MNSDIRSLLEGIQNGSVSVDDALLQLKQQPFEDIGYAKVICTGKSGRVPER